MTTQKHILIVDADRAARMPLASMLTGMLAGPGAPAVLHATSGGEAAAMVMAREPRVDAMILEAELPDEPGSALCDRLRRRGVRIPIILVSGQGDEADVVRGLDAGANDYVVRPYRPTELLARLRAQLRAFEVSEDAVLSIGPYLFRPGSRQLHDTAGNHRIRLTEKETAVLKYLYRAGGEPVGRKALLREVWGYSPTASTHTVETHIYRLRRKIEPDPTRITLLVNEDGGYRLDPNWRPEPVRRWGATMGLVALGA
ncbi:MAG: DNA-binding response regulator [Rhodospirillales bacterium 70-18]|nr:response regulator transcription factor [Rhodospirillales bacterium]OJY64968.1 MAG: DNA-binding response regulator [Rhodospirillales bacterium 70-18]